MIRNSRRNALAAVLSTLVLSLGMAQADTARNPASSTLKSNGGPVVPVGPGAIAQAPLAVCAAGFSKTGEKKHIPTGTLISFECTTPVITCPKNPSYTTASLDVEIINSNPEQSAKRIRYTCKYWTPEP